MTTIGNFNNFANTFDSQKNRRLILNSQKDGLIPASFKTGKASLPKTYEFVKQKIEVFIAEQELRIETYNKADIVNMTSHLEKICSWENHTFQAHQRRTKMIKATFCYRILSFSYDLMNYLSHIFFSDKSNSCRKNLFQKYSGDVEQQRNNLKKVLDKLTSLIKKRAFILDTIDKIKNLFLEFKKINDRINQNEIKWKKELEAIKNNKNPSITDIVNSLNVFKTIIDSLAADTALIQIPFNYKTIQSEIIKQEITDLTQLNTLTGALNSITENTANLVEHLSREVFAIDRDSKKEYLFNNPLFENRVTIETQKERILLIETLLNFQEFLKNNFKSFQFTHNTLIKFKIFMIGEKFDFPPPNLSPLPTGA